MPCALWPSLRVFELIRAVLWCWQPFHAVSRTQGGRVRAPPNGWGAQQCSASAHSDCPVTPVARWWGHAVHCSVVAGGATPSPVSASHLPAITPPPVSAVHLPACPRAAQPTPVHAPPYLLCRCRPGGSPSPAAKPEPTGPTQRWRISPRRSWSCWILTLTSMRCLCEWQLPPLPRLVPCPRVLPAFVGPIAHFFAQLSQSFFVLLQAL